MLERAKRMEKIKQSEAELKEMLEQLELKRRGLVELEVLKASYNLEEMSLNSVAVAVMLPGDGVGEAMDDQVNNL